jgi:signal recognition particle receptor subunit beta/predicted regulator of Ras-like GTPase activity (Roadblock/LC7/MglB family)
MINKNMKKTGIPTLDDCLSGGIPIGKTLIFYGSPLAESDAFVMQAVYTNLEEDDACYYVASGARPDMVRAGFKEYGWDVSKYSRHFEVVDAYSPLEGASSGERFAVKDPESIESYDEAISSIIDLLSPGDLLVFSSLSSLLDHCACPGEEVLAYARRWNKMAVLRGGIVLYNFVDRGYDQSLTEHVKNGLCNATVLVGGLGADTIYGHYFRAYACDWSRPPERPTLFKASKPGGITVHIPKALVTGPQGSGKSTFVRTAAALSAGKYVSVDRMGTTIAGDHAQVTIKGFSMDLFGTPGQKRFIPTIKAFAEDAMGIVVVVDSTGPDFDAALEILKIVKLEGVPYLIAANKQDARGAMEVEDIRRGLDLPEDVPVLGTCANDSRDVQRALEALIGMIVECSLSGPQERFDVVINDVSRMQGVRAAAIVSTGGILKAAAVPAGVQGERLAFATSTILTTAEAASENLRQGKLGRLVVEVDDRRLIVLGAGERNMLVVLTERGNMGPIAAEAERAVDKIKEILGE